MANGTLSPLGWQTFFDDNGVPVAAGLVYTYAAGTSTPITTYNAQELIVGNQNANPIELDAAGRCVIYLTEGTSYKYVLKTAAGATIRTQDNIQAVPASTVVTGDTFMFGGQSSAPVTSTSYGVGAAYTTLHPGTAVWHVDPDDLPGTYYLEAVGVVDAGSLTVALVNLTDGDPNTPIATVVIDSTTGEWARSASAITLPLPGSSRDFAIKTKITAPATNGYAWGINVVRTA